MTKTLAIFIMTICACLSAMVSPMVHAQEPKHNEPLKVPFATGEYPPYSSKTLPDMGATTELIRAVCKAANIQPEFNFFPWKRAETNLVTGTAFGAFPYSAHPERRLKFDFSDDLYRVANVLVYYDGNPKTRALSGHEELRTLKDFKFGIIMGSFAESRLKEYGLDYVSINSVDQLVKMLHLNRIDFYIDDEAVIFQAARRLTPTDANRFRAMAIPFDKRKSNNVMVSRAYPNSAEILKRFNAGLAQIRKTGEHAKILAKYNLQD